MRTNPCQFSFASRVGSATAMISLTATVALISGRAHAQNYPVVTVVPEHVFVVRGGSVSQRRLIRHRAGRPVPLRPNCPAVRDGGARRAGSLRLRRGDRARHEPHTAAPWRGTKLASRRLLHAGPVRQPRGTRRADVRPHHRVGPAGPTLARQLSLSISRLEGVLGLDGRCRPSDRPPRSVRGGVRVLTRAVRAQSRSVDTLGPAGASRSQIMKLQIVSDLPRPDERQGQWSW